MVLLRGWEQMQEAYDAQVPTFQQAENIYGTFTT